MRSAVSVCSGRRPIPPIIYDDLERGIARAAALGFEGIELHGDLTRLDRHALLRQLDDFGLKLSAIMTGATAGSGATLASEDEKLRGRAFAAVSDANDLATESGAVVSIGLIIGKFPTDPQQVVATRRHALDQISTLARKASGQGVRLAVEPMNRYLGSLIHNVDDAITLVKEIGERNVGIMLDTFHMNIEEPSIDEAIRRAGEHVFYVQLSDSNRRAPGLGHTDFEPIVEALISIGYDGWISAEVLPEPDAETAATTWRGAYKRIRDQAKPLLMPEQVEALRAKLNADPLFRARSKSFLGSVALAMGRHTWTLWFNGGMIVRAEPGVPAEGVDITVSGPLDEWATVLRGEKHLLHALNVYHGRLRLSGNLLLYAGNVRPLFYLFSCLKEVTSRD